MEEADERVRRRFRLAEPDSGLEAVHAELAFLELLEELAIPAAADQKATLALLQREHADDRRYAGVQPASRQEGLLLRYTNEQVQLEAQLERSAPEAWQQVEDQLAGSDGAAPLLSLGIHTIGLLQLPACIGRLGSLQTLSLSGCTQLQKLPASIGQLRRLQTLDLSGCAQLQKLPDSIGELNSLVTLDLSGCASLGRLPSSVGKLVGLRELRLAGCRGAQLEQLQVRMGCPGPSSAPVGAWLAGLLAEFRTLDIVTPNVSVEGPSPARGRRMSSDDHSDKKDDPEEAGNLQQLDFLDLHPARQQQLESRLAELEPEAWQQVQRQLAGGSEGAPLLSLGIHSSELAELPACIGRLGSLQVLDLSGCTSLKRLPPSLGDLSSLHTLDLSGCTLLLPSDEQLRNLQRPAEARQAAQQLWAAIRSEQKQESIMEAGGADRLVGILNYPGAGDPLRASVCSMVEVLALNGSYCGRLAVAGAGPALLRLFCRDDFCAGGAPQQRAAPGMVLLEMFNSEAGDSFVEPTSGVALLEQCIDSIVARGDWADAGQMLRLQTAGDLLACLLGMEGQPLDEKSVRLATSAVDGVAFVQGDLLAAGRQAVIDAFVDVELFLALARGSGQTTASPASQTAAAGAGGAGLLGALAFLAPLRAGGASFDPDLEDSSMVKVKGRLLWGKSKRIWVRNASAHCLRVVVSRVSTLKELTEWHASLAGSPTSGNVDVGASYDRSRVGQPQDRRVQIGRIKRFFVGGDNLAGHVEVWRCSGAEQLPPSAAAWVEGGYMWEVRQDDFPFDQHAVGVQQGGPAGGSQCGQQAVAQPSSPASSSQQHGQQPAAQRGSPESSSLQPAPTPGSQASSEPAASPVVASPQPTAAQAQAPGTPPALAGVDCRQDSSNSEEGSGDSGSNGSSGSRGLVAVALRVAVAAVALAAALRAGQLLERRQRAKRASDS